MGGGIKRIHLPGGRGRDGGEPVPGDEEQGGWSREKREAMDQRFADALRLLPCHTVRVSSIMPAVRGRSRRS
jgi:hypothetical protein